MELRATIKSRTTIKKSKIMKSQDKSVVDDTPSLDQIKDMSINIVNRMVEEGIIKDCTDTDDEDEFVAQDIIREFLCKEFKIKNI